MFSRLIANSSDVQSLSDFIGNNKVLIEDFVNSDISAQRQQLDLFEQFVLLGGRIQMLDSLDFSKSQNRAFISFLFDYAERVNSTSVIIQLFQIIQRHSLDIGSRLEAAMLYLYNVPNVQTFVDRFEEICSKLQIAVDEEEDNDNKAVATFLNYYSSVVYNYDIQFAQAIQTKAQSFKDNYPFLQNSVVKDSVSLDINQADKVYTTIQSSIDTLLGKRRHVSVRKISGFIIEQGSHYSELLSNSPCSFNAIRQIAIDELESINDKDEVYRSLHRGVAILDREEQLFHYLKSYGLMHRAKLLNAFSHFSFDELVNNRIEVFDWSCGQGLASIILLEYLSDHKLSLSIEEINLIEPSEIALKRASLHVRHFNTDVSINTLLKDMDSLSREDIHSSRDCVKLHLLSNILDVEQFSMRHFIDLTHEAFEGTNYFVCVSPYINDVKTARIDSFINSFMQNESYELLFEDEARKGEWKNGWTKVIRVAKAVL